MTVPAITSIPESAPPTLLVRLLGPLELTVCRTPLAPKARQTLALLASRAGSHVSMDALIEELWEVGKEINKPRQSVETYVYRLRMACKLPIDTRRGGCGYTLVVDPMSIDAGRFDWLMDKAAYSLGRPVEARDALLAGFSLWRGAPLADVECGPLLSRWVSAEEDRYRTARGVGR